MISALLVVGIVLPVLGYFLGYYVGRVSATAEAVEQSAKAVLTALPGKGR
jgi:hypothetical protein